MKIHLKKIPSHGLHIEGEEEREILEIEDESVRVLSPVRYSLDVGLSDGGLFATGQLAVDLDLECVTCLQHFPHTIEVRDFAMQTELGTSEFVDLTDEIREDILLALPPHPHCDWNGERTCAGVRNATISSEKSSVAPEPGTEKENPWVKLDQLGSKKTNE